MQGRPLVNGELPQRRRPVMPTGPTRLLFAGLFFPIGITSARCGLSSVTVLVMSIAKRSLPTQKITRECWLASGSGSWSGFGWRKGVCLVGIRTRLYLWSRSPSFGQLQRRVSVFSLPQIPLAYLEQQSDECHAPSQLAGRQAPERTSCKRSRLTRTTTSPSSLPLERSRGTERTPKHLVRLRN